MTDKPTAAKGTFPYPHRTVAEAMPIKPVRRNFRHFVDATHEGEPLSGYVERPARNAEMDKPPPMTAFGRFKRRTWKPA